MKYCLIALLILGTTSCYTIKNHSVKEPLYYGIFHNETDTYGLENELSRYIPTALRKEYIYYTTSNQAKSKYQLIGKITKYRKKIVRRDSNGFPTHQQVEITISFEIHTKNKKGEKLVKKINNIDYRLNSGYYSVINKESEAMAKAQALKDIAGLIATEASTYFLGKK